MSNVPQELKYTQSHEWILAGDDGQVTVGITTLQLCFDCPTAART